MCELLDVGQNQLIYSLAMTETGIQIFCHPMNGWTRLLLDLVKRTPVSDNIYINGFYILKSEDSLTRAIDFG